LVGGARSSPASSRRSIAHAMPPMLAICMSSTTRSGACWATAPRTSCPRRASTTSMSGPANAVVTWSRTQAASAATRIVVTRATLLAPCDRPRLDWVAEEDVADLRERLEVVHVVGEVRHVRDRSTAGADPHGLDVGPLALGDL